MVGRAVSLKPGVSFPPVYSFAPITTVVESLCLSMCRRGCNEGPREGLDEIGSEGVH